MIAQSYFNEYFFLIVENIFLLYFDFQAKSVQADIKTFIFNAWATVVFLIGYV